jgi:regulator of cell morphogenesis and NO signaling
MKTFESLSLAQIVTEKSEAAMIFERHHLDFCCRGKQSLSEAMHGDQKKLDQVKSELEQLYREHESKANIHFEKILLSELAHYIVQTHHQFVRDSIPVIREHVRKISSKHGERHPELKIIEGLFSEVCTDLMQHMMKEELVLFPAIIRLESHSYYKSADKDVFLLDVPVEVMEAEHEHVGKLLDEIRKLTNNYTSPADACTTYKVAFEELRNFEFDLHQHVHLENNILFPKAMAMQSQAKRNVIN